MAYRHREGSGPTVLLIHGNGSSSLFWEPLMEAFPASWNLIAPDLRGYGDSETKPVDATHGFKDFAEDVLALTDQLHIEQFHVAGHSLGGGSLWYLLAYHTQRLLSVTFINPASPYGFGGTKDDKGTPCWPDFAGSGGGIANPLFAERIQKGDRSTKDPASSPRVVIEQFYGKAPFKPANAEALLDSLLQMRIGKQFYPGDYEVSVHYPFVRPGKWGPLNAASPAYQGPVLERLQSLSTAPPLWWARGAHDQIVSDSSFFDLGTLGQLGLVENYPGEELYPSQPMLKQTRGLLAALQTKGIGFKESVFEHSGHSPQLEEQERFTHEFHAFLSTV